MSQALNYIVIPQNVADTHNWKYASVWGGGALIEWSSRAIQRTAFMSLPEYSGLRPGVIIQPWRKVSTTR